MRIRHQELNASRGEVRDNVIRDQRPRNHSGNADSVRGTDFGGIDSEGVADLFRGTDFEEIVDSIEEIDFAETEVADLVHQILLLGFAAGTADSAWYSEEVSGFLP